MLFRGAAQDDKAICATVFDRKFVCQGNVSWAEPCILISIISAVAHGARKGRMTNEVLSFFSNGQESYFYQLFIEKDDRIVLPTTQQLLGQSFLQSDIKLAEVCLPDENAHRLVSSAQKACCVRVWRKGTCLQQCGGLFLQVPSCLILQMPRFGKSYKMYNRIVPSLYLDITDILEYGE